MGGFFPQRPIISWLGARKVKQTLRSHIFLTIWCSQYARYTCMDFVVSVVVCALLLGTRAHPLVKSETSERAGPQFI
jgi:hypothetical protein